MRSSRTACDVFHGPETHYRFAMVYSYVSYSFCTAPLQSAHWRIAGDFPTWFVFQRGTMAGGRFAKTKTSTSLYGPELETL